MSEISQSKSVIIEGDKSGFVSNNAVKRFGRVVREKGIGNLVEMSKEFLKSGFEFELISEKENSYNFRIKTVDMVNVRDSLKSKLKTMKKSRTNNFNFGSVKSNSTVDIPKDIQDEYTKIMKLSKIPIPDPAEILQNPDQYRPMLSMILNNKVSNPFTKYFKLIANKIGINPSQTNNNPGEMNTKVEIKGNAIKNDGDTDTESETE